MKSRTSNPAEEGVSPVKTFQIKAEEKKEKTTGQGGVRTTQQAIHLLTKSYGS